MASTGPRGDFDILIVAQGGGIDRQAAILAASLARNAPGFGGRLVVAEPQPGGAWAGADPRMSQAARAALAAFGAEIRPLHATTFGRAYPHGNKIEALGLLDPGRPFLFLDSDTLVTGDLGGVGFDFARPAASMRREPTWPRVADEAARGAVWQALYARFGLDVETARDPLRMDWQRYPYFNAGWFFGADPAVFGRRFRDWAMGLRDDPGAALAGQSLDPWLDQVILPLVIHSLGGGKPGPELDGLDADVTWHYRNLPLLYALAPDAAIAEYEAIAALPEIAPLMAGWEPAERLIAGGEGRTRIRPMFTQAERDGPQQPIRKRLKAAGLWLV